MAEIQSAEETEKSSPPRISITGDILLYALLDDDSGWPASPLKVAVAKSELGTRGYREYTRQKVRIENTLRERSILTRVTETPLLNEFSRDLTRLAQQEKLDPCIGRETEMQRVVKILSRRSKNNPLLVGEPGVGKTAIVEGLAQKIAADDPALPESLRNKRILELDLSLVVAGTKYRGQFEERLKAIMKELKDNPDIIVFIDEIHTMIGAGSAEGSLDAANILKPALARGEIKCLGATTSAEYRKYIEKDRALERRFQAVKVDEPGKSDILPILRGQSAKLGAFHNVTYSEEVLEEVARLAPRYIDDRFSPDREIDLLDEAGAQTKLARGRDAMMEPVPVPVSAVHQAASDWKKIPLGQMNVSDKENMRHLDARIGERVFAQDAAVQAVAKAIKRNRSGWGEPGKPVGSFLFLGPTGVGKTELAKTLAELVMNNPEALIRFDMSEYMEKHAVSKLIGSPPGYVGHEEGGQLTEKVKRNPYSVVLLDEIEKAHPDIFNILLQVLDDGHLTDSLGNKINFKNTIVIMTSNIGTRVEPRKELGFKSSEEKEKTARDDQKRQVLAEVNSFMRPEFRNRLDGIVFFDPLPQSEIRNIARKFLAAVGKTAREQSVAFDPDRDVSDDAYDYLVRHGHNPEMGARPMNRLIQKEIVDVIVDKSFDDEGLAGSHIRLDVDNAGTSAEKLRLVFEKAASPSSEQDQAIATAPDDRRTSEARAPRGP